MNWLEAEISTPIKVILFLVLVVAGALYHWRKDHVLRREAEARKLIFTEREDALDGATVQIQSCETIPSDSFYGVETGLAQSNWLPIEMHIQIVPEKSENFWEPNDIILIEPPEEIIEEEDYFISVDADVVQVFVEDEGTFREYGEGETVSGSKTLALRFLIDPSVDRILFVHYGKPFGVPYRLEPITSMNEDNS